MEEVLLTGEWHDSVVLIARYLYKFLYISDVPLVLTLNSERVKKKHAFGKLFKTKEDNFRHKKHFCPTQK